MDKGFLSLNMARDTPQVLCCDDPPLGGGGQAQMERRQPSAPPSGLGHRGGVWGTTIPHWEQALMGRTGGRGLEPPLWRGVPPLPHTPPLSPALHTKKSSRENEGGPPPSSSSLNTFPCQPRQRRGKGTMHCSQWNLLLSPFPLPLARIGQLVG